MACLTHRLPIPSRAVEPPEVPSQPPAGLPTDVWDVLSFVGTGAAAVIALAAAGVAVWQAHIARGARDATEERAKIAREALEDQRAERHEQASPAFDVTIEPQTQARPAGVRVRMHSGPGEVKVEIKWRVRITWNDPAASAQPTGLVEVDRSGIYMASLVENASVLVYDEVRPAATVARALAKVSISATETGGAGRRWQCEKMADYVPETP